jgi:predicted Zn-dependent protease
MRLVQVLSGGLCLLFIGVSHARVDPSLLNRVTDAPHRDSVSLSVPSLGAEPNQWLLAAERQQGEAILRDLRLHAPLLEDPWTQQQLLRVFHRLSAQASLAPPVALLLIQDPQINAFAVSGGLVAVYSGLIQQAESMDQIAGVLAHEVAHVSQRHLSRREADLRHHKWLSMGGMVAGILLSKADADAGAAVATGSQAAAASLQLAYGRDQEREADRMGMQLMSSAGYSAQGMANFFDVMQRHAGQRGFLPDFVLSHPLTAERMSEAQLRAAQLPQPVASADEQLQFRVLKGRIAALTGQSTRADLAAIAGQDDAAAASLVTVYRLDQRFDDARQLLMRLQAKHPNGSLWPILAAEIELAAQRPDVALTMLTPLHQLTPEDRPLSLLYAQALIDSQQPQAAIDVLQPMSQQQPSDTAVWQLLQTAASRLPDLAPFKVVNVLRYRAEYQFWRGQVDAAIVSLERARVLAEQTESLRAKIDQRVQQMREAQAVKIGG